MYYTVTYWLQTSCREVQVAVISLLWSSVLHYFISRVTVQNYIYILHGISAKAGLPNDTGVFV
jgi:hypothetical protein